ncbi:hypothetical protein HBB16_06460, partial [Pseudonocardia sp. MCCB 268]|nr:hypothetical protein [Pseudonocardia cytotoxica]
IGTSVRRSTRPHFALNGTQQAGAGKRVVRARGRSVPAARAEEQDGPRLRRAASGGLERSTASLPSSAATRSVAPDGLRPHWTASLRRRAAPSAAAGQAPATHGLATDPPRRRGAAMPITTVPIERLACPGCHEPVLDELPSGWPDWGRTMPEFSHRDGSVPAWTTGAVREPVEVP